jgi:hypothetical protein
MLSITIEIFYFIWHYHPSQCHVVSFFDTTAVFSLINDHLFIDNIVPFLSPSKKVMIEYSDKFRWPMTARDSLNTIAVNTPYIYHT